MLDMSSKLISVCTIINIVDTYRMICKLLNIRKDIAVEVKSLYNYVLIVSKCICENKNGGGNRDHWLCEEDGLFSRSGRCNTNEWCIGPYNKINATFSHDQLCMKGTI